MSKNIGQFRFSRQTSHFGNDLTPTFWQRVHLDPWLLMLLFVTALSGLGILYSASAQDMGLLLKQTLSFSIAFTVMIVMAQVPPSIYRNFTPFFYIMGIFLLILVEIIGEIRLGAQRWIKIPGFGSVQPSEFMKLGMPMLTAWFLSRRELPPRLPTVFITLVLILIPVLLIAKQPDLGTSLLVASSGLFVLFLSGLPWWMIGTAIAIFIPFVLVSWEYLLHDYQKRRVMTLLDPEADALGDGWNIMQSKTAIGSGGISGKGYLEGTQSHLHFLPEGHTDFIIAAFSEEFGLIGVCLLMFLYFCILLRVLYLAYSNTQVYGRLLCGAIAMSFFVYVFVNAGMVSGILPVVGVPLPFISYGGTALITLMASFGLVMSMSSHNQH